MADSSATSRSTTASDDILLPAGWRGLAATAVRVVARATGACCCGAEVVLAAGLARATATTGLDAAAFRGKGTLWGTTSFSGNRTSGGGCAGALSRGGAGVAVTVVSDAGGRANGGMVAGAAGKGAIASVGVGVGCKSVSNTVAGADCALAATADGVEGASGAMPGAVVKSPAGSRVMGTTCTSLAFS